MKNLFYRILTAAILLPVVIYAFIDGGITLALLLSIIAIIAASEIAFLISSSKKQALLFASVTWAGIFLPAVFCSHFLTSLAFMVPMFLIFHGYLLFANGFTVKDLAELSTIFYLLTYLFLGLASIFWLQNAPAFLDPRIGLSFILLASATVWLNDSFAYFGGRLFGKHHLFPSVSAKKTWEGFLIGGFMSLALVLVAKLWSHKLPFDIFYGLNMGDLLFVAAPAMLLGPLGDLVESRIKRLFGTKDSSNILPGHGGVFDRIDALLLVMPWTALYACLIRPLC